VKSDLIKAAGKLINKESSAVNNSQDDCIETALLSASDCRESCESIINNKSLAATNSVDLKCKSGSDVQNVTVSSAACTWRSMLRGPPQAPLCKGHREPCVLRDVKKDGPNKGRQFWVCCKPQGHKSNPDARCDYFVWVDGKSK